ncbi:hypothetical protein E2C01_034543 [Portunus trituberculatus]|uniref:Uncharacterized protein n=1 Tax=Portunus trituberculatus TaxID=210409 RepID=A0A5B7F5W9_PORTR|nr:hypothetical protein [Portunus trituberculatus]
MYVHTHTRTTTTTITLGPYHTKPSQESRTSDPPNHASVPPHHLSAEWFMVVAAVLRVYCVGVGGVVEVEGWRGM